MNIAVLITTPDFAGLNIQNNLFLQAAWQKTSIVFEEKPVWLLKTPHTPHNTIPHNTIYMFITDTRCIHCEHYDQKIQQCLAMNGISFPIDLLLFPTTHRSGKEVSSICVHSPGNFGSADLGGVAGKLCPTNPQVQRFLWEELKRQFSGISSHNVVMEATHHGPALDVPTLFVEIGSGEDSWKNPLLGKKVAAALLSLFNSAIPAIEHQFVPAVGIGGPHYVPNFLKVMETTSYAFGHLCAKYNVDVLTEELIRQALEASRARVVVLDWKGLGSKKAEITSMLEKNAIPYKRTDQF